MKILTVIETVDLTFGYEDKEVLKGIDLKIEKGKFTAILGRNGSGKSTLAKHFNAILLPEGGTVLVCKMDTKDEKRLYDIRKKVGMVFQNPDNQIVATTVEEDVAFGLENLGIEREKMVKKVEKALKEVGMYEKRKSAPHNLSGGQKQRVAIAGIIAMKPEIVVFDEPTAMLDPKGRKEVMEAVGRLKELGITTVLITHYMDEAARADRICVIDGGRLVIDSTPRSVFAEADKLERYGIELPQSVLLLKKLKERGMDIKTDALNEEECAEAIDAFLKEAEYGTAAH